MSLIDDYKTVCEQAARAGGAVLRDYWGRVTAREKGRSDLVTEADLASQDAIRRILSAAFPTHGFLGEENVSIASRDQGLRWLVDPLDGTTNYVHGIPVFAVSIGLEQDGDLLVGVVYDPSLDQCFSAAKGQGAYLDGRPLHASRTVDLSLAVVATSFPPGVRHDSPEIPRFIEVLSRCRATRRTGSTALNLCYLAAGRFDAYWSFSTCPWDIAAGALLVTEAGGVFSDPAGGRVDLAQPRFVAAGTHELHAQVRAVVNRQ